MGRNNATSLEDRLLKFAEEARAGAEHAPLGREKEVLLSKARKAEAMAGAANRLKD